MRILNLEDALREGNFEEFMTYFNEKEVNTVKSFSTLNALELVLVKTNNLESRLKIIKCLIESGVDLDYIDKKQ